MSVRRVLAAIPLAFALTLLPQAASAAENRPQAPVMTSPTATSIDAPTGSLVASGTGIPGDEVFINAFPTMNAYRAAIASSEKSYQAYESGHFSGFGGGDGATVDASGQWKYTVDTTYLKRNVKGGVSYVAAFQFIHTGFTGQFPWSVFTKAVKVQVAWLGRPSPPRLASFGAQRVVHVLSDGSFEVRGTGIPGAIVLGFVDSTGAGMRADVARFEQVKQTLGTACPAGNTFCATAQVASDGTWSFGVDAKTARSARAGALLIAAAQSVNNASNDRWSPASTPLSITLASAVAPDGSGLPTASSPSVFSQLLAFNWRSFTPAHVALTAGAALVLTLVLGFPTALLNSALEESYTERVRRLKPITEPFARLGRRISSGWQRLILNLPKAVVTIAWFLVAAIIAGFADPAFGFNPGSLRLLLSLFLAFALLNVLGAYVTWWATASTSHTRRPTFPSRPSNLAILAVTVLVARIIHLEPAIIFGPVLGLDFGVKLAVYRRVRVILVGAGYAAIIGILAWLAYSAVPATSTALAPVAAREFLSQLAVAGIATLPVTLLPFRSLNGATLFSWQRPIWGISYAVGLVLFLFVLLPMPFSWGAVTEPLVAWISLFLAYSIIAILIWLGVRYRWFSVRSPAKVS